jgi:hypothetical protein
VAKVQGEVEELRGIMVKNIGKQSPWEVYIMALKLPQTYMYQ